MARPRNSGKLKLYRRHLKACEHKAEGRQFDRCRCPIWLQGTWAGETIRKSLDVDTWGRAEELKRDIESGKKEEKVISVEFAIDAFVADGIARNLNSNTISKYKLLSVRLKDYVKDHGIEDIRLFTNAHAIAFRGTWKGAPRTQGKTLERLRSYFGFCIQNDWISKNPAKGIKAPTVKPTPTLPFTNTEVTNILKKADFRSQVFFRTLLYSGLRITDAAQLRPERIENGKLFLYTQKTGTAVRVPLPPDLLMDLGKLNLVGGFYFVVESDVPASVAEYYRVRLLRAAEAAGLKEKTKRRKKGEPPVKRAPNTIHPHRFRDSFACNLLLKGVSLEDVSILLGHSSIRVTEKSYAPWIRARQRQLEESVTRTWPTPPTPPESFVGIEIVV